ncbi:ArsR family transcriptional regulator [Bifidobacterium tibiigranuli]|uniref:ArsR family transcriptional regulator n=2 Tax=Bifidobacterium TaxID=1678 RepID=A0A5N6S2U0_9BIFI|nr:ArsR family transcriptional regulator [Bifidobacterium tibiigranuli]KAE8129038.1 transcriptional regulator [Bifidobacterium tibiigranuli]
MKKDSIRSGGAMRYPWGMETNDAAKVSIFKALSDEGRLKIVRDLYSKGEVCSCADLGEMIAEDTTKQNISYHIKILKQAGLVTTRKVGQAKTVAIRKDVVDRYLPGLLSAL